MLVCFDVDEAVRVEQLRRHKLNEAGIPYHYWKARGDSEPPESEHWCDYCQGYYGVPHGCQRGCRWISRAYAGQRQCACIECVLVEVHSEPLVSQQNDSLRRNGEGSFVYGGYSVVRALYERGLCGLPKHGEGLYQLSFRAFLRGDD
jgi:hypothetical protein